MERILMMQGIIVVASNGLLWPKQESLILRFDSEPDAVPTSACDGDEVGIHRSVTAAP